MTEPVLPYASGPTNHFGQPVPEGRRGSWSQTCDGEKVWMLDPRPEDVRLAAIARGQANRCRYGCQLKRRGQWYAVAEHAVLVSILLEDLHPGNPRLPRIGLLHDAAEGLPGFGDVPRPLKREPEIHELLERYEEPWNVAVYQRFDCVPTEDEARTVSEVDRRIAIDEIAVVMMDPTLYYARYQDDVGFGVSIACLQPVAAEYLWLARFAELFAESRPVDAAEAMQINDDATREYVAAELVEMLR